jgi:hypothetical protein
MAPPVKTPGQSWRRRAASLGLAVAALWLLLEAYARWPSGIEAPAIEPPTGAAALILVVHGSFGRDEPELLALDARLRALTAAEPDIDVRRYLWSPYSDNILRAAARGERIGAALGERLGRRTTLRELHLIAHSAGAYLLEPLCESARRAPRSAPLFVRMTFLDPIGLRGSVDRGYGAGNFGRCADLAEVFFSTDDPAPATDRAYVHARNFDVTRAPGRAAYPRGGHRWPVRYYLDRLTRADLLQAAAVPTR